MNNYDLGISYKLCRTLVNLGILEPKQCERINMMRLKAISDWREQAKRDGII